MSQVRDALRDWKHSKDCVDMQWLMLQQIQAESL